MKKLLVVCLGLLSTAAFAQKTLKLSEVKTLLEKNKAKLEKVETGMTKQSVTTMSSAGCTIRVTSTDTLIKLDADKAFVYSKEKFQPQNSKACQDAGHTASSEQNYVYLDIKPSVAKEVADFEELASSIKKVTQNGNVLTMNIALTSTDENGTSKTENVTNKLDLTKSLFDYGISSQSVNYNTSTTSLPKTDLAKISLKDVIFCDNTSDEEEPECVQGDFSDILF